MSNGEAALAECLETIAEGIHGEMSEGDVEDAFIDNGFFSILGFERHGHDIRKERTLPSGRRPDITTLRDSSAVVAVYEFKEPDERLPPHRSQLERYVTALKAEYGVLTNGRRMWVFEREGDSMTEYIREFPVADAPSFGQLDEIERALQKGEWSLSNQTYVDDYLEWIEANPLSLDNTIALNFFFDSFRFDRDGPFGELVAANMELLAELRDEQSIPFVSGAFRFWRESYANLPRNKNVPRSWRPFVTDDDGNIDRDRLADLVFSLETGFALLSRLFLAKASDDYDFFRDHPIESEVRSLGDRTGDIDVNEYPELVDTLIGRMVDELVESLFEDDIFVWWIDGYRDLLGRSGHDHRFGRLSADATLADTETLEPRRRRFSRAVAELVFAVLKFDFSQIESIDLLGGLYQRYFDAETRKALGEFYTPAGVVDLIMDRVGYEEGIHQQRLLDPACGSGTFLRTAVERYLQDVEAYHDDPDWTEHLADLCYDPRVAGIDIHPFAVLMAQISYMLTILPKYRLAKEADPDFTLRRLPVFRADTLENERFTPGADIAGSGQQTLGSNGDEEEAVRVPVKLPIERSEGGQEGFETTTFELPRFESISELGAPGRGVANFGDYFRALQAVLYVVQAHASHGSGEFTYDPAVADVERALAVYDVDEPAVLGPYLEPYVSDILERVEQLAEEYGDSRLLKVFEDVALGLLVKNYLTYDFVVANPPYVAYNNLDAETIEYLQTVYEETTTGKFDLYCPFYQRAIDRLSPNGRLGFITPNQFMVTEYGAGVRSYLSAELTLDELYDFRDSGVFEDATNYPVIVIGERDGADEAAEEGLPIRCVRVKRRDRSDDVDDEPTDLEFVDTTHLEDEEQLLDAAINEGVLRKIRSNRANPGFSDEDIDVFDVPTSDLSDEYWAVMPPDERAVFDAIEERSDALLTGPLSLHAGTQTGRNEVYIVYPQNADIIDPDETEGTVTVVPSGGGEPAEIERALLRPWLPGANVNRWRADWSGEHVVFPYETVQTSNGSESQVIRRPRLEEEYPATWRYFQRHRESLQSREGGDMAEFNEWYKFSAKKSHVEFEQPKAIVAETASETRFMFDEDGRWFFKSAYGAPFPAEYRDRIDYLIAYLNSSVFDFFLKHVSSLKSGGHYKYTTNYVGRVPVVTSIDEERREAFSDRVQSIITALDTRNRIRRFPQSYLEGHAGEIDTIEHTWAADFRPITAVEVVPELDGFHLTVGSNDTLEDPWIGDREANARYVRHALEHKYVNEGDVTRIPYPAERADVDDLLERLAADVEAYEGVDIGDLERALDDLVFDLYDLGDEQQRVVDRFLREF